MTSWQARVLIALLLGLVALSALGLRETLRRQASDCEIRRDAVVNGRAAAKIAAVPLPLPSTGDLEYINALSAVNAGRELDYRDFLAGHPVPSCS